MDCLGAEFDFIFCLFLSELRELGFQAFHSSPIFTFWAIEYAGAEGQSNSGPLASPPGWVSQRWYIRRGGKTVGDPAIIVWVVLQKHKMMVVETVSQLCPDGQPLYDPSRHSPGSTRNMAQIVWKAILLWILMLYKSLCSLIQQRCTSLHHWEVWPYL